MHEVRKITGTHGYGLGIKRWGWDTSARENHGPDLLKHTLREISLNFGSPFRGQRITRPEIDLSFLTQIPCDSGNHLGYTFFRGLSGIHYRSTFFPGHPGCILRGSSGRSNERCFARVYANYKT